ncbi:MAG TPA: SRPBCC domain-containing protein [Bryobacteraceae bacterium]|nr:SRPBCC domain-containing protein [Bryobacteraceae bacterium]
MQAAAGERTGNAFRLQRRFKAPPEKVFRAWTDPQVLKRWWCPEGWTPAEMEVDLRAGGRYRIGMRRLTGGATVYVHGSFLQIDSPEKLVYTWRWENAFEGMPETRVTVRFAADGVFTLVMLTHENLPEIPVCLQHRSGWIAAWDRLETAL